MYKCWLNKFTAVLYHKIIRNRGNEYKDDGFITENAMINFSKTSHGMGSNIGQTGAVTHTGTARLLTIPNWLFTSHW